MTVKSLSPEVRVAVQVAVEKEVMEVAVAVAVVVADKIKFLPAAYASPVYATTNRMVVPAAIPVPEIVWPAAMVPDVTLTMEMVSDPLLNVAVNCPAPVAVMVEVLVAETRGRDCQRR